MSNRPDRTYLARTFEDDRYAWARRPVVRHRLVIAEVALLAVLVAATLAASSTDDGWTTGFFVVWTTGMLAFIPLHSLLNLGIRGVFDRSRRSLDEHQLGLRERAFARMGWPSSALTFLAWSGGVALVALTTHVVLALCWGFLLWLGAGLLPYWHLAWTAPAEPAVDE